jgi:hypothetical protein
VGEVVVIELGHSCSAFQKDGMIQVIFDEAFPPYKMYGNSIADFTGNTTAALNTPTDVSQSVVACCNELPGPNTQPVHAGGQNAEQQPEDEHLRGRAGSGGVDELGKHCAEEDDRLGVDDAHNDAFAECAASLRCSRRVHEPGREVAAVSDCLHP